MTGVDSGGYMGGPVLLLGPGCRPQNHHHVPHIGDYEYRHLGRQGLRRGPGMQGDAQGSGSGLDPDSIGSVDPDPDSESGSGSRRAKITQKSRKKFVKVHVLKCWMPSFES